MARSNGLTPDPDRPDGGPPPSSHPVASGPLVGVGVESAGPQFFLLTLKADEYGGCIATYIWSGFAHVSTFDWNSHDDDVEIVAGDDWPEDADASHWYETASVVADWLSGTEGERRLLCARVAGEYLAARAA